MPTDTIDVDPARLGFRIIDWKTQTRQDRERVLVVVRSAADERFHLADINGRRPEYVAEADAWIAASGYLAAVDDVEEHRLSVLDAIGREMRDIIENPSLTVDQRLHLVARAIARAKECG